MEKTVNHPNQVAAVILILVAVTVTSPVAPAYALGRETLQPASGHHISPNGITSADVLARATLLRDELEAVRFEMGKPRDSRRLADAAKAAPHEVYFQAITLYLKADRLALELTGSTGIQPEGISPLHVRPYHVWKMVNAAYERMLTVKQELGIKQSSVERQQDPATSSTEVGYAIVRANRQINRMLERRFTPSDAFQQVTVAIGYTTILFGQFPGTHAMPKAPPLERGKDPADVFLRLAASFQRLESIARHSGLEVLHLDSKAAAQVEVLPSDVYDIATLLVSDLAYLHAHLKTASQPPLVPYPGRKFPSHVYQETAVLQARLEDLEKRVQADPNWLSRQP